VLYVESDENVLVFKKNAGKGQLYSKIWENKEDEEEKQDQKEEN